MPRLRCTYKQAHSAARQKVGEPYRTGEWQYEFFLDGKFQFKVTIPHGRDTDQLRLGTLKSIQRQLHLTNEQFMAWRDCPLDRAEYERIIREQLGL